MRDLFGNTLKPGSLLWWLPKQIPIRVARIEEPSTVTINRHASPQKTKLVLEVVSPIDALTDGVETQLADFLCIVNPDAERIVEEMLAGQRKQ